MNRWWIYQKERFPLAAHGPLIAAFSASAVSYSALLRGPDAQPEVASFIVAFVVSLGSFLLLRIADEFKDAEEDARFRPYRPVPRGLVTLRELALVGVLVAIAQLSLALWLGMTRGEGVMLEGSTDRFRVQIVTVGVSLGDLRLAGLLFVTWIYFALMSREFFAREWLKARPVVYLFSHMLIMPLIDWFATGCDWVRAGGEMPAGLFWFLAASFCNGIVIELGRKIRAPDQEETGVETYTFLWGRPMAVGAWLAAMAATLACAIVAAQRIAFTSAVSVVLGVLWAGGCGLGLFFVRTSRGKLAKLIEAYSGVWTLALYLTLGVVPLLVRK
jgi:4-hydroxybenzoate polyprenyltransferase